MDIKPQCRLCLSEPPNFLNILIEKIDDTTIATILTQHFWFEVKEGDSNVSICLECWKIVKDFHLFYKKVYNTHCELISKLEQNIKVEIDEPTKTDTLELLENDLKQDLDSKCESSLRMEINHEGKNENDVPLDMDHDNNSNEADNPLNLTDNESSSAASSSQTPQKRPKKSVRKTRKTKTAKTAQIKKDIDPIEQAKIDQQNKQISEYFSMTCELCSVVLDSFRNLQIHYRIEHNMKGYVRCCNRKYIKRVYILEHLGRHLNPETFRCDQCNKNFAAKRCLQLHLRSHIPTENRPYKCPECPKTYVIANLLKRHIQTHATERKFVCNDCGKSYITDYQLKTHQRNSHSDDNTHICDVCAKPFRSKDMFEKHHKSVHGKVPLPKVQCNICDSWVKDKYYLKQHVARHLNNNARFPCSICNKSAPNARALQSHMRVVHTEKIYKCNMCDKTFKRKISLIEHTASHTGNILYSCPFCSKTFNSSANMYTHRKKSHVREWEELKLEKFKADAAT